MSIGFIYIWRDKLRNMYYIGCHIGHPEDGYICSSSWLRGEIKYRPNDFKRKIIKFCDTKEELLKEENNLLSKIKYEKLGIRYYNIKTGRPSGTPASNKGKPMSEEQKIKISQALKKKKQGFG